MLHTTKQTKGFSLVELLVVMAIMITLGGVGYQAMSGNKVIARDTARKEALGNLQQALENYYSKNNFYPQPAVRYEDENSVIGYNNVWGFIPGGETEALPSCKLAWNSELNQLDETADVDEDLACGGLIYDRSSEVVVGWKGTLTEFSGKNSVALNADGEYFNPLTQRDDIVTKFDKSYFDEIPTDPSLGNIESLTNVGIGSYIYSAYRKGIDLENNKNIEVGASQYQLAATMENSEEPTDATAYVIGNYVRKTSKYSTKINDAQVDTYLPYSLIGSKNVVVMNGQKIDEPASQESCPETDRYSDDIDVPCNFDDLDGTDMSSGNMGVPYPVVF